MENINKNLPTSISKKDWEKVLDIMNKNNLQFGFVDFDSNGNIEFYDFDPFNGGVHAMAVSEKHIKEIVESYK